MCLGHDDTPVRLGLDITQVRLGLDNDQVCLGLGVTQVRLSLDVTQVRLGLDVAQVRLGLEGTQVKDHPGLPDHHTGLQLDLEELAEPGVEGGLSAVGVAGDDVKLSSPEAEETPRPLPPWFQRRAR